MPLPVSAEYLALALESERTVGDNFLLRSFKVGDLHLPTGQLVACDPLVGPDTPPFTTVVPTGQVPVHLSILHRGDDERIAFASLLFQSGAPTRWQMLTTDIGQDPEDLKPDHIFGYPVDSGTGCFMDVSAARQLVEVMRQNPDFYEVIIAEMDKTYRHTRSWMKLQFGEANMIGFSSGEGDGVYATYAGWDEHGALIAIVTDFEVVGVT